MNDALYEQLVARRQKTSDFLIRILVILVMVAVIIFGFPFLGFLAVIVGLIIALLAYFLIFPRLNVEYEYTLLNHDMQIDIIYNKAKRKPKFSVDIQTAEIIAPKGSHRLDFYKPDKVSDFSSGDPAAKVYAMMIPAGQNITCIYIEPDNKMTELMKHWMGIKMHED